MDNPPFTFGVNMARIKETLRYARRLLRDESGVIDWLVVAACVGAAMTVVGTGVSVGKTLAGPPMPAGASRSRAAGAALIMAQEQARLEEEAIAKSKREKWEAKKQAILQAILAQGYPEGGSYVENSQRGYYVG